MHQVDAAAQLLTGMLACQQNLGLVPPPMPCRHTLISGHAEQTPRVRSPLRGARASCAVWMLGIQGAGLWGSGAEPPESHNSSQARHHGLF